MWTVGRFAHVFRPQSGRAREQSLQHDEMTLEVVDAHQAVERRARLGVDESQFD